MMTQEQTIILSAPFIKPFVELDFPRAPKLIDNVLILAFDDGSITLRGCEGERFTLGRYHPANRIQPAIDLSLYGGIEGGTSRTHAAIFFSEGKWWLEDLGSSNGTWLNSERLAPFIPVCLQADSRLSLANLEVGVILPGVANASV